MRSCASSELPVKVLTRYRKAEMVCTVSCIACSSLVDVRRARGLVFFSMAFAGSKPPELFAQPKGDALIEGILSASVETTHGEGTGRDREATRQ